MPMTPFVPLFVVNDDGFLFALFVQFLYDPFASSVIDLSKPLRMSL